jgi:hypothetical protein
MDSVFIAARAGVDENAAAPSATVAGPNSTSLRVIVIGTSLSREMLPEAWRAGEGMSSRKVAPQGFETPDGRRRLLVARRPIIWRTVVERHLAESSDEPRLADLSNPPEEVRLMPGQTYSVPPKRAHLVKNAGDISAVFFVLQGIGEYDFVPSPEGLHSEQLTSNLLRCNRGSILMTSSALQDIQRSGICAVSSWGHGFGANHEPKLVFRNLPCQWCCQFDFLFTRNCSHSPGLQRVRCWAGQAPGQA